MYTLRRISGNGVEMNFALGENYTVVDRFMAYESFQADFEKFYGKRHVADLDPTSDEDTKGVYAFVSNEGGVNIFPLYFRQQAYIMTANGSTFSNLTIKDAVKEKVR